MTSQKNKEISPRILALRAEAKALGVRGTHFMVKEEMLLKKIEDATAQKKVVESVREQVAEVVSDVEKSVVEGFDIRKKAPKMNISNVREDSRAKKVRECEAADPDSKYIFQHSGVSDAELAAKGYERTPFSVKNSILVRTDRKSWEEAQAARNDVNLQAMKKIDKAEVIFKGHTAKPKAPPSQK